jgi:hypothetical protein
MNLMPDLANALQIRSIVASLGLACPPSIMTRARIDTPERSARTDLDQLSSARAARICAAVIIALFVQSPIDAIACSIAQFMQPFKNGNRMKEVAMATSTDKVVEKKSVQIPAPKFGFAEFVIEGTSPLVIHRFSAKTKLEMKQKMETGKAASSRKNREAKNTDDLYNEARYISRDGWDGFHAASIRNAMISVCRLVGFKMTLAKMSIFVIADGVDEAEPQIPLIRIMADPIKQEDMARVETGQPYVTVRAAYHDWKARIRIRWDEDQFTLQDVTNLLSRVGFQAGIGEGRYDSPNSCGMGWGAFQIAETELGARPVAA